MFLVPKVMSTQHPDNATPAPFADDAGVLKGDGEVDEAVHVFALGCDEQMWDSEGKEADNQVCAEAAHRLSRLLPGQSPAWTRRGPDAACPQPTH